MNAIERIIKENDRRNAAIQATFNPVTGEGSTGERVRIRIADMQISEQWIPKTMLKVELVSRLVKAGSIKTFYEQQFGDGYNEDEHQKIIEQFVRVRNIHDFPFWAAVFVLISNKQGGEDIHFKLNRAQRKLVQKLENMRLEGKPIRLILLKARQWGGSTCIQIYMAWLQLVHKTGLNSLIVGHVKDASTEVKDMFDKMIGEYPTRMMHQPGEQVNDNEPKMVGVGKTGNIYRIPQRNCKIKIGTAEKPNSARGGAYSLVHLTEVGLWKETEGKKPEDIVRSACSGILLKEYTMIVYESTANGTGNLFHREYLDAKNRKSQFDSLFISWFEIEQYALPFATEELKRTFAHHLYQNRNNLEVASDREEPGTYLWRLWEQGATLEAINWYIQERSKYTNHALMAAEYPSDDVEAFAFSGRKVFNDDHVEQLRKTCKPPKLIGEIYGREDQGERALEKLRFEKEQNGRLFIWNDVEKDSEEEGVTDRYLVIVDVAKGQTQKADFADILVLDRIFMIDAYPPAVVAEWHGHIDMDRLAWKAAQLAEYYNQALLVIESNTLETNNTKGEAEYILNLIRDVYDNLYARKQSAEDIREGVPKKYGYHTNTLTKKVIIHNLKQIVREHLYIEREEQCIEEYLTYIETNKGGFEAMEGHHDDRLMTRAIGLQICYHEMELPRIVQRTKATARTRKNKTISAATL